MTSFKNAPDIMGEALGRLPINPPPRSGKVVPMSPEAPDRAALLLAKLKALRLSGMAAALEELAAGPQPLPLATVLQMERLVAWEESQRAQRRLQTRLRKAGLKMEATLEGLDYSHPRNLDRELIGHLAAGDWVGQGHNLIVTGPIGVGKTYLASALTHAACVRGYSALYRRLPDLLRDMAEARAREAREAYLEGLGKIDLLTLDDWGLEILDYPQSLDLLEIIQARDGVKSTLVASCVPPELWAQSMHSSTVGEAFTDRLVHNAHQISMQGDSMRKEYSPLREGGL